MLTTSQLVRKSAEERNAASVMLDVLASRSCGRDRRRSAENQRTHAVLAANTAGRAKVVVREDATKNGAWAWGPGCARGFVETRERRVSLRFFNTVGRARSCSKTCGASGSRVRSFHKSH